MTSGPIQITIPDLDADEFTSTPIPFGRPGGHTFGAFGDGLGSGRDSPTSITPIALPERADRSYFHARGDSFASDDSSHSVQSRHAPTRPTPFAHSSQSSVATTGSGPFSKKPSFASIRNAFKSGKANDAPPVPQIDHQAYPVLKNPFNRSTSSLAHAPMVPSRKQSVAASPPHPRPPTPGSAESRPGRNPKSRNHSYAKSQHSYSGSIFHVSDNGSDHSHGLPYSSSPPPVPRMPDAFGGPVQRSDSPLSLDLEDKIVMDPRTPSDYALHAIFIRFAASAEMKMDAFLRVGLDQDPLLPDFVGPGVDLKFDGLLQSLSKIAQKHTKSVVDSVMRWRKSHNETVSADIIRLHITESPTQWNPRSIRHQDPTSALNERKSLASIYIMCRALVAVLQSIPRDALDDATGYSLEEQTFEQFRKPDLKLLAQSANHRSNAELYATLLGLLANVRFTSVTDRFLAELNPVTSGQVPKDSDMKYENLVKGLKHIQIKVWPPEAFEEAAEFMESLSKSFANAHGLRLKTAFAETLVHLLHPIGKTAQAEVNHPQWARAIETIYPRAKDMMVKPRYWSVAYPLLVTSLCVAPHQFFLRHWIACCEAGLNKLKEKPHRIPVMNGMLRLVWTYLYRCQEPGSIATTKLDGFLKRLFPANRTSIFPAEEPLEPFIYITHFVLSRHFEYGRDLCLDLIQESPISAQPANTGNFLAPDRTAVAIQAILLSLYGIEREELTPTWPSSTDFSEIPSWEDYPSSSDPLPASLLLKPGMQDFFDRCCSTLAIIADACSQAVGQMSVFDEQWSAARVNTSYEESHAFIIRRHPEGSVAYPNQLAGPIGMLQTCFQSWPRCLHSTLPLNHAVDMLVRGVVHVEPSIRDVATAALRRFMQDPQHASGVLAGYAAFLFGPAHTGYEGSGIRLTLESPRLLNLWVSLVDEWIQRMVKRQEHTSADEEKGVIMARCDEIEAGALFLLTHEARSVHSIGVKVIRMLGVLASYLSLESSSPITSSETPFRIVDLFNGKGVDKSYLYGYDELLDSAEMGRLEQWRKSTRIDVPLRLADSTPDTDRTLWRFVFPALMRSCMDSPCRILAIFRDTLVAAASRYHPLMAHVAGLSSRVPVGLPARAPQHSDKDGHRLVRENKDLIDQWHFWVKILCSTALLSDSRPTLTHAGRDHSRAPSDTSFERERMTTTRGLFRYLTPFLDSEYTPFRHAAVICISSLPSSGYPQLLEDLNLLAARQFYDESRIKPGVAPSPGRSRRQERLHAAVARIYCLTADFLQHQRSAGRQAALAHVLKFVRNTQTFLASPETRDNYTLQRLRRYFCGTVERLFDGLTALKDSDRFIPSHMHLSLYRLCDEWCQFGAQPEHIRQRLILMQRAVASGNNPPEYDSAERFQHETRLLSNAAVGALSVLCQRAFFPPDLSSGSPTERSSAEYLKPLEVLPVLDRLSAILASSHPIVRARGKKALKSLLSYPGYHADLLDEALRRGFVVSKDMETGDGRFFEVVSDVISNAESHGFTFSQVVCLGLSNLCHPLAEIRRLAFNMLETIHLQSSGILSMSQFEAAVGSSAPSIYLRAHRLISDFLAGEHPQQAIDVLSQFATWMPQVQDGGCGKVPLFLLQSLENWIPNIDLMGNDMTRLSGEGLSALYHLVSITLRYGSTHAEQILVLWMRLVESPRQFNGHATIRFLLEQSHKVGSIPFINCAANIVACLSQSAIGRSIFEDLCSVIEPARMLPPIDHKLVFPNPDDMELWSDLDVLFAEQPRLSLGAAQFSLLFLADVTLERQWELTQPLPVLLHAIFVHLDHRNPYVRDQAQRMLFQLMRSWSPGYDELSDRSAYPSRPALKSMIANLERDAQAMFWKDEDTRAECEPKMQWLCAQVIAFLEPLSPELTRTWGSLALGWGTSCSIRPTAFRSLQIHRAILPPLTKQDLGSLLGRLSNTIAGPDDNMQSFTSEIILTFSALTASSDLDLSLLPKIFWCAYGSLSTTVEHEFQHALVLFDAVLSRIDLDDPQTADLLLSHRPLEWDGSFSLQSSLLTGLRSSTTSGATFKILQSLTKVHDPRLIDPSEGRVRDLYTASLPWCLQSMATDSQDESLREFAINIGRLAEGEERDSITRIMESFVKGRFRTKDDFLRQSVSSLREHYGADHWTKVVTLLLGLVLNRERWLRVQSMQILKFLFQQRETRSPVDLLGSELLMPLLRLLESDLASQALEVLEEPLTISGGPAAKHVLRMSMHTKLHVKDIDSSVVDIFGIPEDSGWCVPRAESVRQTCRSNLAAVFDTCMIAARPSRIEFEPEVDLLSDPLEEDLGGLVQNLHELTTYFQEGQTKPSSAPLPSQQLEARVAAILMKSTAEAAMDMPETPVFTDVFKVGGTDASEDSDDDSDTESEPDAFIFDSPSFYQSAPNGTHLH